MALYRSKLGPVGGNGENGSKEGGIAIDLDPLSAFALMGGGNTAAESGAGSTSQGLGGTNETASSSSDVPAPGVGGERGASPVTIRESGVDRSQGLGSWRVIDRGMLPTLSEQEKEQKQQQQQQQQYKPPANFRETTEASAYPPAMPRAAAAPDPASSTVRDRRQSSSVATPSPPRQLRALREPSSRANNWTTIEIKSGNANSKPPEEAGAALDTSTEKIDPLEILRKEGIECLDGELLLVKLQNARCEGLYGKMVPSVLIMTTYKVVIVPHRPPKRSTNYLGYSDAGTGAGVGRGGGGIDERYFPFGHLPKEYLQVPMTYIDKVERDSERKGSQRVDRFLAGEPAVTIHCKDARRLRVSFGGPEESDRALKMLQQLAFPGQQMEHLFAFSHRTVNAGLADPGWHIYDPQKEFDRMGVLKPRRNGVSPWRTTDLNENYGLCASYPKVLVVPASVSDAEVEVVSQFRSEQRLPVLCWGREEDSASIWRSSQPKIGISRATCAEDEHMLGRIAAASPVRMLPIVDCRPRSNATANFAAGYGYESYADCPLEFSGIGNIHVMRESLAKLENLCLGSTYKDQDWTAVVEDTRWLSHVRNVLSSAWTVAVKAHTNRAPVLVHCSHGWDRTSQVCALAQLLMDPYYRTMDGFQVLIEKDWLAFGHPFHLRHAYGLPRGVTASKEDQRSPIFLQFLDCTWQLVMQLPSYFEFNPRFLLCIADHIQSCRFGTFLCNTNKARRDTRLDERCGSLWTFLELHRSSFLSKLYHGDAQRELLPPLPSILRHVRLWNDYFLRWSPAASFVPLPLPLKDDTDTDTEGDQIGNGDCSGGNSLGATPGTQQQKEPENGASVPFPLFRCEFDEMEMWVTQYEQEANRWRRKAMRARDEGADFRAAAQQAEGHEPAEGGVEGATSATSESEELALARQEILQLKAALSDKESLLRVLLSSPTPEKPSVPLARAYTAPTKHFSDRRTTRQGGNPPNISRTHVNSRSSSSLAAAAAEAAAEAAQIGFDDDDLAVGRPRGHSSTMESREVRRSSMSEMNFEEDRGRCLTAVRQDSLRDGGSSTGDDAAAQDASNKGHTRSDSPWKWEFTGWSSAKRSSKERKKTSAGSVAIMGRRTNPSK